MIWSSTPSSASVSPPVMPNTVLQQLHPLFPLHHFLSITPPSLLHHCSIIDGSNDAFLAGPQEVPLSTQHHSMCRTHFLRRLFEVCPNIPTVLSLFYLYFCFCCSQITPKIASSHPLPLSLSPSITPTPHQPDAATPHPFSPWPDGLRQSLGWSLAR